MAETVLDQILADLRKTAVTYYPNRGELKNLRVVGHAPRNDHMIYDVCADFFEGSERMAVKIYRPGKCGGRAPAVAGQHIRNPQFSYHAPLPKNQHRGPPPPR